MIEVVGLIATAATVRARCWIATATIPVVPYRWTVTAGLWAGVIRSFRVVGISSVAGIPSVAAETNT